ncbi:unnamed protein product [Caenorhabditis bovis]|uniref:Uncharacterized protein n=1 Tax=Caenorhabditis bovis TaxID=2654633 RepID=A0A8S1ESJ9_9PELO|nr:unnamed protein product [Caenorhabditis bovis]
MPFNSKMLDYSYEENQHLLYWPESSRLKQAREENKPAMNYTMPGIREEFMRSSIDFRFKDLYNKFFPNLDIPLNQRGLSWFIKKGLFEAALNGTSDMLTWLGQGKEKAGRPSEITQVSMEVWSLRFQLLINLRMHAQLLSEIAPFEELDAPDLYYQYRSPDKTGSYVPFTMRLIHAESLRFSPFPWRSLIRISKLWEDVESIIKNMEADQQPEENVKAWRSRLETVKLVYVRVLHELGEYKQSMAILEQVRNDNSDMNEKLEITRAMMRMAMQAGDEKSMNLQAEYAHKYSAGTNEMILHKAFRSIFLGAFTHANDYIFRIQNEEKKPQILNTKAIVQLYSAQTRNAVETLMQIKPLLDGPTTTNLKTMAELCYSTAAKDELLIR